jgi:hypothetical protein
VSKSQLPEQQEPLAAKYLAREEALSRIGDAKSIVIGTQMELVNQWCEQIHRNTPSADVYFYGTSISSVSNVKYHSFIKVKPELGMAYTLDYLAKIAPAVWKLQQNRPSYFLVAFPCVKHMAARFDQWFDYAIEDEYQANRGPHAIRDVIRNAGRHLIAVHR